MSDPNAFDAGPGAPPAGAGPVAPRALIDGRAMPLADACIPLTDEGVARGDGAFETVGVWDGRPFRLDDHLDRLAASLHAIRLPAPDRDAIGSDAAALCDGLEADAALRLFVTASGTRIVTLSPPPVRSEPRRLSPQVAPWIRPRGSYRGSGAKTMSYSPNMAATRAARADGADDALLVSLEGYVLEGPTFFVAWAWHGLVYTPEVGLGLVDSISRRTLTELAAERGIDVIQGRYRLADLAGADEFMICSSVRPLLSVPVVGDHGFSGQGSVTEELAGALDARRRGS